MPVQLGTFGGEVVEVTFEVEIRTLVVEHEARLAKPIARALREKACSTSSLAAAGKLRHTDYHETSDEPVDEAPE